MRKLLSLIFTLCFVGMTALWADVATPTPVKMKQPDGSTITLRLHGDEFHSWYTSEDGKTIYKQDGSGWWKPSSGPRISSRELQKANERRAARDREIRQRGKDGLGLGWGSNHFLVILVEWSDQKFQSGAGDYFKRALGESGFSDNGSVGSAKDYYTDASSGRFTPNFDVYGPVTLTRRHDEWPDNDNSHHNTMAKTMVQEALTKLDATVDFSQYDNNGDGYIDNVYMFYPGYAQSNGGGSETIWPHAWNAYDGVAHDGVYLNSYACSSELNGNSGTTLNGIGTFCHEFGHVIGMPDLYDTDYEINGQARNPSSWCLMAGGNHNSEGRIPARLSTYERYLLGYITEFEDLSASLGNKTIQGLDANKAYKIPTINDGEFFIPEVRDGNKWDSPLPKGMIIYHLDRSQNDVHGKTAAKRWEDWDLINGFRDHPCFTPLLPVDDYNHNVYYQLWVFPKDDYNYHNVTEYAPVSWGGSTMYSLSNISYSGSQASFTISKGPRTVSGHITSANDGNYVSGAIVVVSKKEANAPGRTFSLAAVRKRALYETTSNDYGFYSVSLAENDPQDLEVSVFATDYLAASEDVSGYYINKDFSLTPVIWKATENVISKVDLPVSAGGRWGFSATGQNYSVAHKYTADELKEHVGKTITTISFSTLADGEEVYVFVDFGTTKRVLLQQVWWPNTGFYSTPANDVDVSSYGITIPEGTDMYIGYIVKNANNTYIIYTDAGPIKTGGFYLQYAFSTEAGGNWADPRTDLGWQDQNGNKPGNAMISFKALSQTSLNDKATISDLGLCYIDIPSSLTAGSTLEFKLVNSKSRVPYEVNWEYDGKSQSGSSVTLTSGKHTIKARLSFWDYSIDTVEATINVK
ncbi:MAG: M6 family metalloprotease domain-containing protein [Bacteroidales bacterium]|nr:M6 family metalloprotease domain-containing protein [Bacteroidales bacterium]